MDLVARIGGEEFAIILPNCATAFGETVAERIRRRVETHASSGAAHRRSMSPSASVARLPAWVRRRRPCGSNAPTSSFTAARARAQPVRLEPTPYPSSATKSAGCSSRLSSFRTTNEQPFPEPCIDRPRQQPLANRCADEQSVHGRPAAAGGGQILAVTSGKGGVGKTFVSANLAAAWPAPGARCWCSTPTWAWPTRRRAEPVSQDHAARRFPPARARCLKPCCPRQAAFSCCWPARAWSSIRA